MTVSEYLERITSVRLTGVFHAAREELINDENEPITLARWSLHTDNRRPE